MELYVIEKSKNVLKLGVKDAKATLISPILDSLNSDEDVKFARYIETHPELDTPEIHIETKKGDAAEKFKEVAGEISKYFSERKKA